MPKTSCDVRKVEFARMWRLTQSTLEPLSFTIPRAKVGEPLILLLDDSCDYNVTCLFGNPHAKKNSFCNKCKMHELIFKISVVGNIRFPLKLWLVKNKVWCFCASIANTLFVRTLSSCQYRILKMLKKYLLYHDLRYQYLVYPKFLEDMHEPIEAIWSGSTLFAFSYISFGCIVVCKKHFLHILG